MLIRKRTLLHEIISSCLVACRFIFTVFRSLVRFVQCLMKVLISSNHYCSHLYKINRPSSYQCSVCLVAMFWCHWTTVYSADGMGKFFLRFIIFYFCNSTKINKICIDVPTMYDTSVNVQKYKPIAKNSFNHWLI